MICTKCLQGKTVSGGRWCQKCINSYLRNWRKTPTGKFKNRRIQKRYHLKNKEKIRKYNQEHYIKNGKKRGVNFLEVNKKWAKNNPEKIKAHLKVFYAVKDGKLIKPLKCLRCQAETRLLAHHLDYSKPLEVVWLCSSCHRLEHLKNA